MKAMVLEALADVRANPMPLRLRSLDEPVPAPGEVLLRVTRCGVCHTELDEIEGRTPPPRLPVIPGHQVVGIVVATLVAFPAIKLAIAWAWRGSPPHAASVSNASLVRKTSAPNSKPRAVI